MSSTITANPNQRIEELGRIIMAYSEVTDRLQQSHEKLQQTVVALREELGEKNRLLERKNRLAALGEMAAGMAHEIRNPLGGIQLYASLLAKDVAGMAPSLELVKKISGGVKRLEGLVSQVLAFSRDIRATPAKTDLAELINRAIELATPKLDQNHVVWAVEGPATMPVTVDPLLIEQSLLNLILNAADAMAERGGAVCVHYDAGEDVEAKQLRLIVKDTGTGLGLAIVHRIVEAHEGTIIASNPSGGGAQFEIRI